MGRLMFNGIDYSGGGGGGASVVQKTMAEYEALPTADKNNGSIYKITDKAKIYCLDEEYHAVKELTTAEYEALTSAEKNNGTIYILTDAETTGEDIPVNTLTPNTSINSAINVCFGRTGSDIAVSTGATETIAEAIDAITVRTKDIRITNLALTAWGGHYYGDVDISSYFTGDESTAEIIGLLPTGMTDGGVFTSYLYGNRTIRLLSDTSGTISIYTCKVLYVI